MLWFERTSLGLAAKKLALALMTVAATAAIATAKESPALGGPGTIGLASLPAEAQQTQALILRGGPFPFPKDGTVFGNRERLLPSNPRGFYREYTVKTPGSRDRGARRIVCGGPEPARPEACFYTADHYTSFKRIVQ